MRNIDHAPQEQTRMTRRRLTPRQQRFVDEYVVDHNATQAAIRAGYSERAAKQQGSRLLTIANVKAAIEQIQADTAARLHISAEDIVREAWAIVQDDEATHSARVSALTLLARRHPEFCDSRKPRDPQQHLHLHAGLEETRRLLARIERTRVEDTSSGDLPTPTIIDAD